MDPPNETGSALLGLLIVGVLVGACVAWYQAIVRLLRGEPLLEFDARRCVPWGLAHVMGIVIAYVLVSVVAFSAANVLFKLSMKVSLDEMTASQLGGLHAVDSISKVIVTVGAIGLLAGLAAASRIDQGFDLSRFWHDVRLGGTTFLLVTPPMYLLQAILTQFWPSEHPVIKLLKETPDPLLITVGVLSAVLIAPLVEEYFFRVIFQGWLENLPSLGGRRNAANIAIAGYSPQAEAAADRMVVEAEEAPRAPVIYNATLAEDGPATDDRPDSTVEVLADRPSGDNPSSPPPFPAMAGPLSAELVETAELEMGEPEPGIRQRPASWPLLISSFVFAAMHAGHGPDPFPLFLLALALGYLYQRTHRILPSLVLHFLINSTSLIMLAIYLVFGGK